MLKSSCTHWLSLLLALFGCNGSESDSSGLAHQGGTGGAHAQGSTSSVGGSNGSAGLSGASGIGGAPPTGGITGGAPANAGSSASGGAGNGSAGAASAGTAGVILAGSANGSAGSTGLAGASGRGPAPTFTTLYNTVITPNCGGAQCHLKRPTPSGYDFSSKSAASASWRSDVIAGDGAGSPMFQVLNFGIMPKDKPTLSVENLYQVLDWIDAGALDN